MPAGVAVAVGAVDAISITVEAYVVNVDVTSHLAAVGVDVSCAVTAVEKMTSLSQLWRCLSKASWSLLIFSVRFNKTFSLTLAMLCLDTSMLAGRFSSVTRIVAKSLLLCCGYSFSY